MASIVEDTIVGVVVVSLGQDVFKVFGSVLIVRREGKGREGKGRESRRFMDVYDAMDDGYRPPLERKDLDVSRLDRRVVPIQEQQIAAREAGPHALAGACQSAVLQERAIRGDRETERRRT